LTILAYGKYTNLHLCHITFSVDRPFASEEPNDAQWTLCVTREKPAKVVSVKISDSLYIWPGML